MIVVKPDPVKEKTAGGIIIAQVTKDRESMESVLGTIYAVGPAVQIEFEEAPMAIGDHVLYAKYAGYLIKDTDTNEDLRIIDHKDILARM
jgi:chaperonin GroES